ncbi:hypothetical protein O6H91_15G007400 [Diphasiastrum complanatum]|uniref:Uncharacterized protein n=1 Tax=Diphasiastrum complanatum TaxID=34168 RepID=A0ACC2BFJ4_DIPCM|nr:hypothetical protein O6H91_15G007400 [Diphasiastrum complanatum]
MPKDFSFCQVCRRNHNQGRGHRYSAKHKECLAQFLSRALNKIQDVRFFLENVQRLRDEDRYRNKFWCYFCEEEVGEQGSLFACSNAIKHLSSSKHVDSVIRFCSKHGVDLQKQQLYLFSEKEFTKWEELCRLSSSSLVFCGGGMQSQNSNHIHLEQSCIDRDSFPKFSFSTGFSSVSSISVQPLPVFKDRIFQEVNPTAGSSNDGLTTQSFSTQKSFIGPHDVAKSKLVIQKTCQDVGLDEAATTDEQKDYSSISSLSWDCHSNKKYENVHPSNKTQGAQIQRLSVGHVTSMSRTFSASGDVHSGALPPWAMLDEAKNEVQSSDTNINSRNAPALSRTQERKLAKLRNPKRVGAIWAERRRVELERQGKGESQWQEVSDGTTWLPSFGRVWQSGSRRESRKEFEAEKRLERKSKFARAETPQFQPYVRKRATPE